MAQLISVKLSRFDNAPWGFRLQGGKDFGTPLVVQKVNGGSPAEAAGLRAGDAVIKVNNTDTFNLRHKDAQDVIVRAGNNFEVTIQRGGSTWKPSVTPVSATLPTPKPSSPASNISPVTKTSLAAKKQDGPLIGSGHNFSPKPFLNGNGEAPIKSIVNKQYNSPVGIYSEETIAETLSAQAEVLAGGVLGVNFKKNEKNYNAENSEVFKMVQEADKEPRSPEPAEPAPQSGAATPTNPSVAGLTGLRHVAAPENKPQPTTPQSSLPPGQNICADCERLIVHAVGGRATSPRSPTPLGRAMGLGQGQKNLNFHQCSVPGETQRNHLHREEAKRSADTPVCHNCDKSIVGVFVRIKDKNLHVECFKCSTCGTSLKNVGYYNINNKLYCDIHAKLVARQNPPAPGLIPVTIPSGKAPAGTISAALANVGASIPPLAPLSPSLNNHSSPQPFNCNRPNMISCSVQDGVQRLRLDNNTSGLVSSMPPRLHETKGIQNITRNGVAENAKTFTSTLIIQTGNEVGSTNNGEKLFYNNIVNKEICCEKKPAHNENFCEFELTTTTEEPTTDLLAISAQPFPVRKQSSHLGASPLSPPVLRPVQAPSTNNIGGLKPFGGAPTAPSLVSMPSLNSGSNTLPRPLSQNASGRYATLPKPKSSLYRDSYYEESDYCEVTETLSENPPSPPPPPPPPSVKSKSLIWPPAKPLEDITYPTASPLYINPNPALNQRHERSVKERHQNEVIAQRREIKIQRERCQEPRNMEWGSCSGPVYRRVEPCGLSNHRESRSREVSCSRAISRPTSRESLRRSLTPTRITQPTPQPWTATVTTGTNLYEMCPAAQPIICEEICEEQQICKKQVSHENQVCESQQVCERKQISHHHHQICQPAPKPVYRPVCPPKPSQPVCLFKAATCELEPEPEPEPEPQPESPVVETEVTFTFRRPNSANLSEIVPASVTVCPKGVEGQHDYLTETTEKDVGPLHIKKTTIYEKTVEVVDPDEEKPSTATETTEKNSSNENEGETSTATETQSSTHLDEEVESISERRDVAECAEIVSSAVEAQQLVEKIKQEEQESVQEERAAASEQISSTVQANQGKRLSFSEHQDLDGGGYLDRHQTVQEDDSVRYEELTEEIRIQENFRQQEIEQQRRQSLREQVQVHQCLREQQIPERRPPPQTLQERRLSSKFNQQDFQCPQQQAAEVTCTKKHVQFVTETESGIKPLPPTTIKNSTPKQWQSEMVKALTTAPTRSYSPLTTSEPDDEDLTKESYTEETCCDEVSQVCTNIEVREETTSPFQSALTTAPDRSYTPLGFYDEPSQYEPEPVCCRSQTPTVQATPGPDGYCAPAEILYTDTNTEETSKRERNLSAKSITPQPLPTPPPEFFLRDSSPPRSRSQTPSNRSLMTGLKKPGLIPAYQRNLVGTQNIPVEAQTFVPSRSSTPTPGRSKSPAQGPPEPPASFIKAQAPKIRDDPPPKVKPSGGRNNKKPEEEGESYTYHEEKSTPRGRLITDVEGSMRVSYSGDEESFVASEKEVIETLKEIKRKPVCEVKTSTVPLVVHCPRQMQPQPKPQPQPQPQYESCQKSACLINKATLTCPMGKSQSDKFPKTGVCVLPPCPKTIMSNQLQSVKRTTFCESQSSNQRTVSQSQRSAFCDTKSKNCPETGVTVIPCKAVSESGPKAGVVVVPSGGRRGGSQSGISIVPTTDRKGLCVSPNAGLQSKGCGQPSGSCGRRSGCSSLDVGAGGSSGVCVTPCNDGSVCVAPCPKPILKTQCPFARPPSADLPFPNIPLPYDDDNEPICPLAKSPLPELNDLEFQPIHKPRTNLGSQLTQLVHKSHKQLVQVYKPQAQCSSINQCQTQSQCSLLAPISKTQNLVDPPNLSSHPDLGTGVGGLGAGSKSGAVAGNTAPKRGRGILTQQGGPGSRVPLCGHCNSYVRGPFITALGNIWCPDHFVCVNAQCRRPLQDIGFVEEKGQLYCEYCFEQFIAPPCSKCANKIKGECLNAIGKHFHPECFNCSYCGKLFGNNPFFLEDGLAYCEADWNELFTTKCFSCGFPVEAGDRWVEALSNNYHSQCFNCTMCKKNLEGQSFYAKGGRPFCKNHAR